MPSSSVRTFTDPDEYGAAVRQGTVNVTVTERGRFNAKICRVDFHELWMQRLSEDLAKTSHVAELKASIVRLEEENMMLRKQITALKAELQRRGK